MARKGRVSPRVYRHPTISGVMVFAGGPDDDLPAGTLANIRRLVGGLKSDGAHTPEVRTIVIQPAIDVVIERDGKNWGAYAPGIPGCGASARSRNVVEQRIREVVDAYFEEMRNIGVQEIAEELAREAAETAQPS